MKKIYLMFFLLQNILFLYAQYDDPYQFFPANVGDRWEYSRAGPDQTYTIIRDSIDTKDSSIFLFYDPPVLLGAKYKIDRNYNVFNAPHYDNRLFYKLDAQVGDSWIVRAVENKAAKVLDISESYIFGKLTAVKTIGFYSLIRGDTVITENSILQYWEKLAYGFGLISSENGATEPLLLRGCRINGIAYGMVNVEEESSTTPSEFTLYQNYPNPFNPTTTISFSIPNYSHVVIRVFDMLGREIQEIANDYFYSGQHSVKFNASNLSSGIYFYQLVADKTTKTMKMILQK